MGTEIASGVTSSTMGKDIFLKMLVSQLKNQDPLNPLDGTDFAAQLAQFSSLEQLTNINSAIETLSGNMSALNGSQMAALIGSEVTAVSDDTETTGTVSGITFEDGVTYLVVDGAEIAFEDVVSIRKAQ